MTKKNKLLALDATFIYLPDKLGLSLIPFLVCAWFFAGEKNRLAQEQQEEWLQQTESLARNLRKFSTLEFWAENSAIVSANMPKRPWPKTGSSLIP